MKQGFTLIELLAVIVILAIIALIATPIVLNIINDTKESATLRGAEFYLDGVEYAISKRILSGKTVNDGVYTILSNGNICMGTMENNSCVGDILEIEVNGEKPNGEKITIKEGKIVSHVIKYGDGIVKSEDCEHTFENYVCTSCGELAPAGLYAEDATFTSWETLVANETFALVNGGLTAGEDIGADNSVASVLKGDLVLPSDEGITRIESWGFQFCWYLTSITIPDGVTIIGSDAFNSNSNLTSVSIPDSVTNVDGNAFFGCDSLTSITFRGTVEQWNAITFGGAWNSGCGAITVHCSDGTVNVPAYS